MALAVAVSGAGTGSPRSGRVRPRAPWSTIAPRSSTPGASRITPRTSAASFDSYRKLMATARPCCRRPGPYRWRRGPGRSWSPPRRRATRSPSSGAGGLCWPGPQDRHGTEHQRREPLVGHHPEQAQRLPEGEAEGGPRVGGEREPVDCTPQTPSVVRSPGEVGSQGQADGPRPHRQHREVVAGIGRRLGVEGALAQLAGRRTSHRPRRTAPARRQARPRCSWPGAAPWLPPTSWCAGVAVTASVARRVPAWWTLAPPGRPAARPAATAAPGSVRRCSGRSTAISPLFATRSMAWPEHLGRPRRSRHGGGRSSTRRPHGGRRG
jgi:hypothetical protein